MFATEVRLLAVLLYNRPQTHSCDEFGPPSACSKAGLCCETHYIERWHGIPHAVYDVAAHAAGCVAPWHFQNVRDMRTFLLAGGIAA